MGKHYVAKAEGFEHTAHQPEFAAAFAAVSPHRRIHRRTAGQAKHQDQDQAASRVNARHQVLDDADISSSVHRLEDQQHGKAVGGV